MLCYSFETYYGFLYTHNYLSNYNLMKDPKIRFLKSDFVVFFNKQKQFMLREVSLN